MVLTFYNKKRLHKIFSKDLFIFLKNFGDDVWTLHNGFLKKYGLPLWAFRSRYPFRGTIRYMQRCKTCRLGIWTLPFVRVWQSRCSLYFECEVFHKFWLKIDKHSHFINYTTIRVQLEDFWQCIFWIFRDKKMYLYGLLDFLVSNQITVLKKIKWFRKINMK